MMSNDKLIEFYFSNRLSKEERSEFDRLYQNDGTFRDEVDFLENVRAISENEDAQQFKTQLESFESDYQNTKNITNRKSWLKPLLAVAAITVIAICINFLINSPINEDTLFATYFEPSKNVSAPIVRSETDETILNNAFIAYNETDYKQALPLFEKAFEKTQNSELLFYEGNALLALGQTENAVEKFKEHLKYSDVLTNRSHWYLALAYLKNKDLEHAKLQLTALLNSDETFKKEEANSLLKKLD
jgi:tetratricopeptide (TPR) repeat protein